MPVPVGPEQGLAPCFLPSPGASSAPVIPFTSSVPRSDRQSPAGFILSGVMWRQGEGQGGVD